MIALTEFLNSLLFIKIYKNKKQFDIYCPCVSVIIELTFKYGG